MTCCGSGIMEAVNKVAYQSGGYLLDCNIVLPKEQTQMPICTNELIFHAFLYVNFC